MLVGPCTTFRRSSSRAAGGSAFRTCGLSALSRTSSLADRHPFEGGDTAEVIYRITSFHIPELQQVSPSVPEDLCAM